MKLTFTHVKIFSEQVIQQKKIDVVCSSSKKTKNVFGFFRSWILIARVVKLVNASDKE